VAGIALNDREQVARSAVLRLLAKRYFTQTASRPGNFSPKSPRANQAVLVFGSASLLANIGPMPPPTPVWRQAFLNGCLASNSKIGVVKTSTAGMAPLFLTVILSVRPPPLSSKAN
jgi:hypothetical protein